MQLEYSCRRCSIYIFIRDSTLGFKGLSEDNSKTRLREIFQFMDLVRFISEVKR